MGKSKHTLEELLDLIDREEQALQGGPKKQTEVKDRVNKYAYKFIQENGIAPGENKYPNFLIFYHFRMWCQKKNYYKRHGLTEFFRTFNRYFEQVRTGRQRYYLLDDTLPNDEETIKKAKLHNKIYRGKRRGQREKKQQKKQDKILSTQKGTESEV